MIYTRRILLTLTGLAVLGIAIPACWKMLGQILFSPLLSPLIRAWSKPWALLCRRRSPPAWLLGRCLQ
jgi:hypothetical protein